MQEFAPYIQLFLNQKKL